MSVFYLFENLMEKNSCNGHSVLKILSLEAFEMPNLHQLPVYKFLMSQNLIQ